jgi:hypothetical protein
MTAANASRLSAEISKQRVPGFARDGVMVVILADFMLRTIRENSMAADDQKVPRIAGLYSTAGSGDSARAPILGPTSACG